MKTNIHYTLVFCCLLTTFLSACKKESTEATLTIKVLNPNNNPAASIGFDILNSTDMVSFRSNLQTSNSLGEMSLTLTKGKTYLIYLIASQNYIDWYLGNSEATLIPTGTFKSNQEINQSPIQKPTPKVGDTKFADFNGDGAINIDDLILKVVVNEDAQITINLIAGRKAFYKI